ncbi:MAG: hypothetical protein JRM72_01485 [Nitrososphaerota archaeon]|jgi:hypothetical protein|nr:hypothetical protein [Nitrososphaerota archaeon]
MDNDKINCNLSLDTLKNTHPAVYNQLLTEMAALEEYGLVTHTGTFSNLHPETIEGIIKNIVEPLSETHKPMRVALMITQGDTGLSLRYQYEVKVADDIDGVEKWRPLKDVLAERFNGDLV